MEVESGNVAFHSVFSLPEGRIVFAKSSVPGIKNFFYPRVNLINFLPTALRSLKITFARNNLMKLVQVVINILLPTSLVPKKYKRKLQGSRKPEHTMKRFKKFVDEIDPRWLLGNCHRCVYFRHVVVDVKKSLIKFCLPEIQFAKIVWGHSNNAQHFLAFFCTFLPL